MGNPYPELLQTALGSENYTVVKRGFPGYSTDDLQAIVAEQVYALKNTAAHSQHVYLLLAGVNDNFNGEDNPSSFTLTNLQALTAGLVGQGWKVIIGTLTNTYLDHKYVVLEEVRQGIGNNAASWGASGVIDYGR